MELFHEDQRLRQWWLLVIIAIIPVIGWYLLIQQVIRGNPVGTNPVADWGAIVIWFLTGVLVPLFFWMLRMETSVTPSALQIRLIPFSNRVIEAGEIASFYARTYRPVREYGGWGLKGWWFDNRAYNMSGNRGVQLILATGDRILVGSQKPEELEHALAEITGKAPTPPPDA